MGRLPVNLGRGLIGVFSYDNLVPALAGGVATSASSFFDGDARQAAIGQMAWSDTFETAGGPLYSTVFVAGMFTAGRFAGGLRFRAMTYDMLDAAVVNFTWTEIIKVSVGRERPNGQDNKSFPSGHTSNAFAMATVAQRHYGWKIGIPAYGLAGLMGVSRIHEDKHWLSDVVAGATLGYIAGRTVTRVNGQGRARGAGELERLSPRGAPRARDAGVGDVLEAPAPAAGAVENPSPRGLAPRRQGTHEEDATRARRARRHAARRRARRSP